MVRQRIIRLALDAPALSPRELAVRFTDTESYFVSEASVYRLLKAHDLIASPAFIVMKAADEFKDKTTAPHQLWINEPEAATVRLIFRRYGELGSVALLKAELDRLGIVSKRSFSKTRKPSRRKLRESSIPTMFA